MQFRLRANQFALATFSVLALSLLLSILLAAIVFPTPMYDTRELIAWGREFPLLTPYHPPVMAWIGGITDRLFGASAVAMILVGQILAGLGLWYFYQLLVLVSTKRVARFFTFLFGTSFYLVFAPLSFALNADILQITSWPAVVFHFLSAANTKQFRHWIALGIWSAIAFLTKYNAAVLFLGMAIAGAIVPRYRQNLWSRGSGLALVASALLVLPHIVVALSHRGAIQYGLEHMHPQSSLNAKVQSLLQWMLGILACFTPGIVIVAFGFWRGFIELRDDDDAADTRKFLLVANIAMQVVLCGLVILGGINYLFRFSPPYVMIGVLALGSQVRMSGKGEVWASRCVVPTVGCLNLSVGAILATVYTFYATHSGMQEPTSAGAQAILADWDSRYTCGPAYFLGIRQRVYGIGIAAGRNTTAIATHDLESAYWFDREKLRRDGAVVIDLPEEAKFWADTYQPNDGSTPEYSVTLPLRRSHQAKQFTYWYHFLAPEGCNRTNAVRLPGSVN